MGTQIDSIKSGSVEADLHNELMNPPGAADELKKAQKVSDSTDPGKVDFSGFDQGAVNLPSGVTTGEGNTGETTSTIRLLAEQGLAKAANQPTQPSSDLGRVTGYD